MTRQVEIRHPRSPLPMARVRMVDAFGWLYLVRPAGVGHWCLVAVELDGDVKRSVGVSGPAQAPGRPFGVSDALVRELESALDERLGLAA